MPKETRCAFIREWIPVLQSGRSSRPGLEVEEGPVPIEVIRDWITSVKDIGVRSIICLLSEPEMEWWYSHLPGGLLRAYEAARIEAVSIPVPLDIPGILAPKHLRDLEEAFARLPRPTLIHCSAGQVRSGAALRHLVARMPVPDHPVEPADDAEISRLIQNSALRHRVCALRTGAHGMDDYGRLASLLARVELHRLEGYLDAIDAVRHGHRRCLPCSLKFLAFCAFYTDKRLPKRHERYMEEFHRRRSSCGGSRDFHSEVRAAVVRGQFPVHVTKSSVQHARTHFGPRNLGQ
jgi:hypothetical protein